MTRTTPTAESRQRHAGEVIDRAFALLVAHDMAGFAGLWAPDGSMEFPFASADYPERVDGRDAITDYLSHYPDVLDVRGIAAQTRHQTGDPDTVIVEFEVDGVAVATGLPYRMRYISVVTVRAEGIASYRDYWSPLAAAEAVGAPIAELHDAFSTGAE